MVVLVTKLSFHLAPELHRPARIPELQPLDQLCNWDCGWYVEIARSGYTRLQATNFFPLYPALGRAFQELTTLEIETSLVLVSNLCGLAALVVIYRLFEEIENEHIARIATGLLVF